MVLALFISIPFTTSSLLNKYLTGPKRKFNTWKLSFGAEAFVGFFLTIGLLVKIAGNPDFFSWRFIAIGTVGGIFHTLAVVLINKAYTLGPLGPVSAMGTV